MSVISENIEKRIANLGLALPEPVAPVASYRAWSRTGSLVFVSGQLPFDPQTGLVTGCLGRGTSIEDGRAAARLCALALMAQIKDALGDLGKVKQIVRIGGFVCAEQSFTQIADVINGCSDLLVAVFGKETGQHARAAVACPVLPLGALVETDAIIEAR